jgi:four helix bundle protein
MGARHHEELRAWRLCDGVRQRLRRITARQEWRADLDLRSQVRRAIRSACGNISEGFWRYRHPEFAHFVTIARGSLGELLSHLSEATGDGLLTVDELGIWWRKRTPLSTPSPDCWRTSSGPRRRRCGGERT